jgi:hypothetical protein
MGSYNFKVLDEERLLPGQVRIGDMRDDERHVPTCSCGSASFNHPPMTS